MECTRVSQKPNMWLVGPDQPTHSIQWLPLSLSLVLAATAIPVELRYPSLDYLSWHIGVRDCFLNVLLFILFGFSLGGRPLARVLAWSCVLSFLVETVQIAYPNRDPSLIDIVSNSLGGILGGMLARLRAESLHRWVPIGVEWSSSVVALAILLALTWTVSLPRPPADFSNWAPEFQLAVGDELTHNRSWNGRVESFAIFDMPMEAYSLRKLYEDGPVSEHMYEMSDARPVYVWKGTKGFGHGEPLINQTRTRTIYEALRNTGKMTIVAWIQTNNITQTQARIVTFSKGPYERNFTLEQEGRGLVFRLRTPVSGVNGYDPYTGTPEVLEKDRPLLVAGSFDGGVSRIFLNGRLVGRVNLKASNRLYASLLDSDAPLCALLVGCLSAVVVLGLWRPRSVAARYLVGGFSGIFGITVLVTAGGLDALPDFTPWSFLLGAWGGVVIPAGTNDHILPQEEEI